jgi:hypothetical protein
MSINDIQKNFKDLIDSNDKLLDSALKKYSNSKTPLLNNAEEQILNNIEKKALEKQEPNISRCPFFKKQHKDINMKFEPHYQINFLYHPYDFVFDKLNYDTKEKIDNSKTIRNYSRHLRNTLFIRDEKVKKIRKMEFQQSFLIGEELKEKIEKVYLKEDYFEALKGYNLLYSLFKWIEFKNKNRELEIFNHLTEIRENPINDDDIIKREIKINEKIQYEKENYLSMMLHILKRLSYCYMNLRNYKEAMKCLNEALEYANDTLPDIYFRRGQVRMYNKFSNLKELNLAFGDFTNALCKKITIGEEIIRDHYNKIKKMISEKQKKEIMTAKKFLHNFRYACDKISSKNLKIPDCLTLNIEMVELNYKVLVEIKETYFYTMRHILKNNDLEKFKKALKEFDNFLDGFYDFEYYYKYDITNLDSDIYKQLNKLEKNDIELIKTKLIFKPIFDEIKLRKCEEIFMNLQLNQQIYEKAYQTVFEKQRLMNINPFNNENSNSPLKFIQNYIINIINDLKRMFQLTNGQFYFMSVIIFIASLTLIIIPIITR